MNDALGAVTVPVGLAPSEERSAVARVWSSMWRSRLLVWVAGCLAVSVLGTASGIAGGLDPVGVATSFGKVGNLLAAPAVRWDGTWYLQIAHSGFNSLATTRFFPLYPLLIKAASLVRIAPVIAAVAISMAAMFVALLLIHRLTVLELGEQVADLSVELVAFCPVAVYFSAVYSESLLLALTLGSVYSARRGRWALAGLLGCLAALTRVTGFLVVIPVVIMFLYGPRTDAAPVRHGPWWLPRYRLTPSVLWAALIPAGTALYGCYLKLRGYGLLAFEHAQTHLLHHVFAFPVTTIWWAAEDGWNQLQLGIRGWGGTLSTHHQSVVGLVAVLLALLALCAVFRRLPACYGLFVLAGLLIPLSSPVVGDPLKGLPRYESVLFPLYMGAAAWAVERGVKRPLILGSAALLVLFTAQFATWHVVGSQAL
jgi:Mannosyltransferase (PIG-V)